MQLKILKKQIINDTFAYIVFEKPHSIDIYPGQFINIKIPFNVKLLRRPFSVFEFNENSFSILIKIVGKGTKTIAELKQGEYCDILLPLGNAHNLLSNDNILFIAGGIGIAGIHSFIQNKDNYNLLFGDKNGEYKDIMKRFNIKCKYISESGIIGNKGIVTDYIDNFNYNTIIACGPKVMLKAISQINTNADVYVVYEEIMACGLGLCNGCAVKLKNGKYKMVCKDGPVFNGKEIVYE